MVGLNLSNLNRTIKGGAEKGEFVLKKGASGKITLPPKNKTSSASKEVSITLAACGNLISCLAHRMPSL